AVRWCVFAVRRRVFAVPWRVFAVRGYCALAGGASVRGGRFFVAVEDLFVDFEEPGAARFDIAHGEAGGGDFAEDRADFGGERLFHGERGAAGLEGGAEGGERGGDGSN